MPHDPDNRAPREEPSYRVHRSGSSSRHAADERPYNLYRSLPRGLRARLRGESDPEVANEALRSRTEREARRAGRNAKPVPANWWQRWTVRRVLKWLALAIVGWLLLSLVLFVISAQIETGNLPSSTSSLLAGGGNMVTSANTVLILGTDQRPRTGPGSKEPGSNYNDAGSRSDTIMLWRIGGGVSRRLSIPRDTAANIPGHGVYKINAGYAFGGPTLELKTIEQFTGIPINHIIIVNLAAFPAFIDAIGGVDVKTGRVCSDISGGARNGGFSLYLRPGVHHLNGWQALTYARTRENKCNLADNDLTRVLHQQQILNAIRSKLFSPSTFFRLPFASWDAPKVLRTDMGGLTLLELFAASELGGSAPTKVLKPTGAEVLPNDGDALTITPQALHTAIRRFLNG
jgi:LCP family protein required for cell wall assembly